MHDKGFAEDADLNISAPNESLTVNARIPHPQGSHAKQLELSEAKSST